MSFASGSLGSFSLFFGTQSDSMFPIRISNVLAQKRSRLELETWNGNNNAVSYYTSQVKFLCARLFFADWQCLSLYALIQALVNTLTQKKGPNNNCIYHLHSLRSVPQIPAPGSARLSSLN